MNSLQVEHVKLGVYLNHSYFACQSLNLSTESQLKCYAYIFKLCDSGKIE